MLRIAAKLPVKLFDDTNSLSDNRNRGLVLTAIGHLFSHGDGTTFTSATTWKGLSANLRSVLP